MNFSEFYRFTHKLVHISPDGTHLAYTLQFKLFVREMSTLQVVHTFTCVDPIQDLQWSPDSQFILVSMKKRHLIQVFSLEHPDWQCKIDEGSAGLHSACWSPDSRHVLSTAEFHLRVTLWSLVDKSVSYMKHPKSCSLGPNMAFTPGGRYMALLERRNCRDQISIFDCHQRWSLVKHFLCDTENAEGISWSPDGRVLTVWDYALRDLVVCYDCQGHRLASLHTHELTDGVLGVKTVAWAPSAFFLAVGGYDQRCRVMESVNWCCIAELSHPLQRPVRPVAALTGPLPANQEPEAGDQVLLPIIYKEVGASEEETGKGAVSGDGVHSFLETGVQRPGRVSYSQPVHCQRRYLVLTEEVVVPSIKPDPGKPNPKVGVGLASFSSDAMVLATRNDNQPTALWLWSLPRFQLAVLLLQCEDILSARWDPGHEQRLALCTGSAYVYVWTPGGCLAVQVPTHSEMLVLDIQWHPNGDCLLLIGEKEFGLCFFEANSEAGVSHIDMITNSPILTNPNFKKHSKNGKQDNFSPRFPGDRRHLLEDGQTQAT